ncbi:MAG: hypothetical protein A3K09_04900 [Nitrospinae bacterium RIFCSPLOWO2_12_FULL_47_7]|nr:MAG: hypothetical protein A3K09_04900 [Nitrospinae bacterium RIFCSPLOWO2_12_FULL_47_7]
MLTSILLAFAQYFDKNHKESIEKLKKEAGEKDLNIHANNAGMDKVRHAYDAIKNIQPVELLSHVKPLFIVLIIYALIFSIIVLSPNILYLLSFLSSLYVEKFSSIGKTILALALSACSLYTSYLYLVVKVETEKMNKLEEKGSKEFLKFVDNYNIVKATIESEIALHNNSTIA